MSAANARPIYADIERTAAEMQAQRERIVQLQDSKRELDTQIQELKLKMSASKDIGTFKFIADQFNLPLDTIVMAFICIIIAVFDPLAIALLLSYNSTLSKTLMKDKSVDVSNRIYDLSDGL
jgi:ABC-type phosphate/phosphonate transport system permease subunit